MCVAGPVRAIEIPKQYPDMDLDKATAHLVIATLVPGEYHPEVDKPCIAPGTAADASGELLEVCVRRFYYPYWLRVQVRWWVVGELPVTDLVVSSSSHYGPEGEPLSDSYFLFPVFTDGKDFVKTYREDSYLIENRWGELYLPLWNELPPDWLPCSVEALREPISAADFAYPIEGMHENHEDESPDNSRYLRFTATGVEPRFAISMSRLRAHLAGRPVVPGADALECKRE